MWGTLGSVPEYLRLDNRGLSLQRILENCDKKPINRNPSRSTTSAASVLSGVTENFAIKASPLSGLAASVPWGR